MNQTSDDCGMDYLDYQLVLHVDPSDSGGVNHCYCLSTKLLRSTRAMGQARLEQASVGEGKMADQPGHDSATLHRKEKWRLGCPFDAGKCD